MVLGNEVDSCHIDLLAEKHSEVNQRQSGLQQVQHANNAIYRVEQIEGNLQFGVPFHQVAPSGIGDLLMVWFYTMYMDDEFLEFHSSWLHETFQQVIGYIVIVHAKDSQVPESMDGVWRQIDQTVRLRIFLDATDVKNLQCGSLVSCQQGE